MAICIHRTKLIIYLLRARYIPKFDTMTDDTKGDTEPTRLVGRKKRPYPKPLLVFGVKRATSEEFAAIPVNWKKPLSR